MRIGFSLPGTEDLLEGYALVVVKVIFLHTFEGSRSHIVATALVKLATAVLPHARRNPSTESTAVPITAFSTAPCVT